MDEDNLFSPLRNYCFKLTGEDLSDFKCNYLPSWLLLCAITTATFIVTVWVPAAQIKFQAATGEEQNAAIRIIIRLREELQFVFWVMRENESIEFLSLVIYCRYCICFDVLCEFRVKGVETLLTDSFLVFILVESCRAQLLSGGYCVLSVASPFLFGLFMV